MGTCQTVYVGPYIKAPKYHVDVERDVAGCPSCRHRHSDKFCNKCGAALGSFKVVRSELAVNARALCEQLNEAMHTPSGEFFFHEKFEIFLPNRKINGVEKFDIEADAEYPIAPQVIEKDLERFKEQFGQEINTIIHEYKNEAAIKWGIIVYYS